MPTKAVFFDVDFTLIYPGPMFQGEGYRAFGARHGIALDPSRFDRAVTSAASLLDGPEDMPYDADIYLAYTRHIIEHMGGGGARVRDCAREIYLEWAVCRHFVLYDDVRPVLHALVQRGIKLGLISNSHRSLSAFEEHFQLGGLIAAAVSSSDHGYLKPHPSIFEAALSLAGVEAAESLMVGDSVAHDIEGARRAGIRSVLVHRSDEPVTAPLDVPVIRDLSELLRLV